MGIMISHYNDPYAPISKDKCHKGFERCSLEALVDSPRYGLEMSDFKMADEKTKKSHSTA